MLLLPALPPLPRRALHIGAAALQFGTGIARLTGPHRAQQMAIPANLFRAAILTGYSDVAQSLGLDPRRLLKSVGLHRLDLSDADTLIPVAAVLELLERSAGAADVEDFGLRMAARRSLAHLGPVGLVAREEPTLRDAIRLFERHFRLRTEMLILNLEEHDDVTSLGVQLMLATKGSTRQVIELIVGIVFRTLNALASDSWAPESVHFSHPPPLRRTAHGTFFRCRPHFGSTFDGLLLRTRDLDAPIATADPVMARYVRRYLDEVITQPATMIDATVRQLVFTLLPSGRCTSELLASHLGIDRRTLSRRLAALGTSFSQIQNGVRVELAQRHIKTEGRTLVETAHLLGFAGLPAFSRWFKAQFGRSASQWRKGGPQRGHHGRG
ncbi:AraC family transcriptional regulator [Bradyrhizobium sp. CB1650]|uniref:AraC family transcriptional regulator n=1 Tax=Bradyrhizobium sp. CB1650 TaxID=3039153 RepID=UPI00243524F1|nr:AraC family transcriptional regulator [Bradyrhizobium sp. CB1650]WGD53317.1 AraC family transcriptional regulator [Bradyrhizobium sp. CB1650]